jgi:cation:H+ antiporter
VASLPLLALAGIFLAAAGVTWFAGIQLAKCTDSLDTRLKLGDALGGMVLLGIAGTLPEIAVCYAAARAGEVQVILGNLLGGLAIHGLLVTIFDAASSPKRPLSYLAGTIMLSIETLFAIVIALLALAGAYLPAARAIFHVNPLSVVILAAWIGGLLLINKLRVHPRYNETAEDQAPGRKHHERRAVENHPYFAQRPTSVVLGVFLACAAATLVAGFLLERSGTLLASHVGLGSGLFAATFLALATSLPEISIGLEAVRMGDYALVVADTMGGNAFMLVIFLLADLTAKQPVLSSAGRQDLGFGFLAVAMMGVYAISFVVRPRRCFFRLGLDSILELVLYGVGLVLLSKLTG